MKRVLALITVLVMLLNLCACDAAPKTEDPGEKVYKVGVVQLMQHVALDQATEGFKKASIIH